MEYFLVYFFMISAVSVFICVIDKHNAAAEKWRISEKTLFLLSFIGGALAMYLTMRIIHHKTRHKRFMWGLPIIMLLHCGFAYVVFKYLLNS